MNLATGALGSGCDPVDRLGIDVRSIGGMSGSEVECACDRAIVGTPAHLEQALALSQTFRVLAQVPRIEPPVPVRAVQPEDLHAIQAVDQRASGMDRNGPLNALLGEADTVVIEQDGEVAGYGRAEEYYEVKTILGFA